MAHRPQPGVAPPHLAGRRTGRPKGSRDYAAEWADVQWAYDHRAAEVVEPPSRPALLWWRFASLYPDELRDFMAVYDRL